MIGETLDSVLAQNYQNWECIVVDDGSSDNTDAVMKEYTKKDTRFKYYHRTKEYLSGGNGARNYGFKKSKGEYIKWFDSDDLMHPDLLKMQINNITTSKSDITMCEFSTFNQKKIVNRFQNKIDEDRILQDFILKKIKINLPVILFGKNFIKDIKFDETLRKSQDLDFIYKVLKLKPKSSFLKLSLCSFRLHSDRISSLYRNFDQKTLISSINVKKTILFNEYEVFNEYEKKEILNQYLSEVKSLLYGLKFSLFFKYLNYLRDRSILNARQYYIIVLKLNILVVRELTLRNLKKLYRL
jgi:glycosyltransferase involved in cell wall biosynthesis